MGNDYFSNVMTMFAHFRQNLYHFINAPVDRTTYTWNLISFPFTVNAFHLQQLNSIGMISYISWNHVYLNQRPILSLQCTNYKFDI